LKIDLQTKKKLIDRDSVVRSSMKHETSAGSVWRGEKLGALPIDPSVNDQAAKSKKKKEATLSARRVSLSSRPATAQTARDNERREESKCIWAYLYREREIKRRRTEKYIQTE
jgi:hypothetical protein